MPTTSLTLTVILREDRLLFRIALRVIALTVVVIAGVVVGLAVAAEEAVVVVDPDGVALVGAAEVVVDRGARFLATDLR